MASLRGSLVKLAHERPELRPHLLPLLRKRADMGFPPAIQAQIDDIQREAKRTIPRWKVPPGFKKIWFENSKRGVRIQFIRDKFGFLPLHINVDEDEGRDGMALIEDSDINRVKFPIGTPAKVMLAKLLRMQRKVIRDE